MHLQWGALTAVESRPALALLVAKIVGSAAEIDTLLGDTFTTMLGADAKPALAMYSALRAAPVQKDAMMAAATEMLDSHTLLALEAVLDFTATAMTDRHRLAHWHWGISLNHPDALLLMKPQGRRAFDGQIQETVMRLKVANAAFDAGAEKTEGVAVSISEFTAPFENALFYTEQDLQKALDTMAAARRSIARIHKLIEPRVGSASRSEDTDWTDLLSEPPLAERIRHLQEKRKRP